MATVNPSKFQSFSLNAEEELVAKNFNPLNTLYLKNLRSEVAAQLLTLLPEKMTEDEKQTYFTRHAFLNGKLDLLDTLINEGE
jgi:hypothetical protein